MSDHAALARGRYWGLPPERAGTNHSDDIPDVVISGRLALALAEVIAYARLRTGPYELVARAELDEMARELDAVIQHGPTVE